MIRLSVCIPTYNRARFIGEAIDSVIAEATEAVEIVVSDNASDDNTEELIWTYQKNFPRIRYFRWDKNVGADRNFLKVIDMAAGDYCWFLGSDDRISSGGIAMVMNALSTHFSLAGVTVGASAWDSSFLRVRPIPNYIPKEQRIFSNAADIVSNLGCYLGYLSGLIVQRVSWLGSVSALAARNVLYQYPAYTHVQVVLEMLRSNASWLSIPHPVVQYRSGNDSFSEGGILSRFELDVYGHSRLMSDYYGRYSREFRSCASLACRTWHRARLVDAKTNRLAARNYLRAARASIPTYWNIPDYWMLVLAAMVPRKLFERARLRQSG